MRYPSTLKISAGLAGLPFTGILLGLLLLISLSALADQEEKKKSAQGLAGFPVLYYTDQTGIAGGFYGLYYFKNKQANYPSQIAAHLVYTQKSQVLAGVRGELFWPLYRVLGEVSFFKFPDTFYGIGNNTPGSAKEEFSKNYLAVRMTLLRRLFSTFYAGMMFEMERHSLDDLEPGRLLESGVIPGTQRPFTLSGVTAIINWDTRNNSQFPTRGMWLEAWAGFYESALGSAYPFNNYRLDLRGYIPLAAKQTVAVQAYTNIYKGTVPFQKYPALGDENLRGYVSRYRDKNLLVLQAGYRGRFWKGLGFVLFGGVGQVSHNAGKFSLDQFKRGIGIGFRYLLIPETGMNLRLDFGFGEAGNSSMEFLPGEAF